MIFHGAIFLTDAMVAVVNNLPGTTGPYHGNSKIEFILEYICVSELSDYTKISHRPLTIKNKAGEPLTSPDDNRWLEQGVSFTFSTCNSLD